MAIAAYVELFDNQNCRIEGECRIQGREAMVEAMAFNHSLRIPTDSDTGYLAATRKHEPLELTKTFDSASPYLYKACCNGQSLARVVIHWFEIDDSGQETEYFRHELENVKVAGIRPTMLNVKHPNNERYPPLEMISMRYETITWHRNDGNIAFSDSWNSRLARW